MDKQSTSQQQVLQKLGISSLNAMQSEVGEAFRRTNNLIILSPTGSGKTLAYLLPLVESLSPDLSMPQAVILVPSRELAMQIEGVLKSMGTSLRVMSCYGGRPTMDEHRVIQSLHPQVLIGTPGRLNDHLHKGNFDVSHIHTLIIDEFDKCLELGFQEEMEEVITQLPKVRKRLLASATDCGDIPAFTGGSDWVKLDFTQAGDVQERLDLYVVHSPEKDKLETLFHLLCTLGNTSTLVFVNYRDSVNRIVDYLHSRRMVCAGYHGGMEQPDRERALYRFRNKSCPVLVSTDLASRGLDIRHIDNVIHYHLPLNEEAFIHRNGRTARWNATGAAYIILHPEERLPAYIPEQVPTYDLPTQTPPPIQPDYTTIYIGKGRKDKLSRGDVVGFLCKKGNLSAQDIGMVDVSDHFTFVAVRRNKVRQLLALVRGEKIKGVKTIIEEAR